MTDISHIPTNPTNSISLESKPIVDEASLMKAAQEFEAAFIAQMLTFSGLDKALTTGGGEQMSAFTGFYIESFAGQIANSGGFGLADNFYKTLLKQSGQIDTRTDGDLNVNLGKV